ncbi:hypothetical protein, partial [Virgisporangium aliadipatigenens]|uniref:hypothetical protein n=1 Tax=Virgisporangium aliadipatigenens TaxID=741659 RepID=UPI001943C39E
PRGHDRCLPGRTAPGRSASRDRPLRCRLRVPPPVTARRELRELDDATVEEAGAVVAAEQEAARRSCPQLPALSVADCVAALVHSGRSGHGVVVVRDGRVRAVPGASVREASVVGRYARFAAGSVAVDPEAADPAALLAEAYAEVGRRLVEDGVRLHYLLHAARPQLSEAWAGRGDRDSVAALAGVELRHRENPPMFGPPARSGCTPTPRT